MRGGGCGREVAERVCELRKQNARFLVLFGEGDGARCYCLCSLIVHLSRDGVLLVRGV